MMHCSALHLEVSNASYEGLDAYEASFVTADLPRDYP